MCHNIFFSFVIMLKGGVIMNDVEKLREKLKFFEKKLENAQTDFDKYYWSLCIRDTENKILVRTLLPELKK